MFKKIGLMVAVVVLICTKAQAADTAKVYIDPNGNVVAQEIYVPQTFETAKVATTTVETQPVVVQRVTTTTCSSGCRASCHDCVIPAYVHHPRLYRPFRPYYPRYSRHHGWRHF